MKTLANHETYSLSLHVEPMRSVAKKSIYLTLYSPSSHALYYYPH